MTRLPPTLLALLLILVTASVSAVAVGALAASPRSSALHVPVALPTVVTSPAHLSGTVSGPLDGLATARQLAEREPVAAVIDNFAAARPQSGLSRASIVYEALVEGGITRLMPIFLEHDAGPLGPIRSSRPYFLDWALPFHAMFVHDGGSPAAQKLVMSMRGLTNVDAELRGPTFHRDQNLLPPHNLFTGTAAVRTLARLRNWLVPGSAIFLPHLSRSHSQTRPTARTVTIRFTSPGVPANPEYTVSYRFDPGLNAYLRSVGGAPAIDSLTGRQIRVTNVVVLVTSIAPVPNDPLGRLSIRTTGAGSAYVFEGGRRISAKWSKASRASPLRLTDADGSLVRLNPGDTWVEVVSPDSVRVE